MKAGRWEHRTRSRWKNNIEVGVGVGERTMKDENITRLHVTFHPTLQLTNFDIQPRVFRNLTFISYPWRSTNPSSVTRKVLLILYSIYFRFFLAIPNNRVELRVVTGRSRITLKFRLSKTKINFKIRSTNWKFTCVWILFVLYYKKMFFYPICQIH